MNSEFSTEQLVKIERILHHHDNWVSSSGVCEMVRLKLVCQATETN